MGESTGAVVDLDRVPLKYAGLRHDEIWISEAQERMVLSVPPKNVAALLELAAGEDVEATVIGTFGTEKQDLILRYAGTEVGRISMKFLHDGLPRPMRKAVVIEGPAGNAAAGKADRSPAAAAAETLAPRERILKLLSHPNIASKHWIIRQYDHEVQGGSVIKPLAGPKQIGPSDAAVIRPKLSNRRGVVLSCGMAPWIEDPYRMALAAIDEAVRNAVAVGADLDRLAILDNFCWPSVDDELTMGTLVRACEACRDASLAYRIPFISGKDSLHNQFTNQETGQVLRIPRTLLISAIGIIDDVRRCVTSDFKSPGARVALFECQSTDDPAALARTHRLLAAHIKAGKIAACHDVSDGGPAVAIAEMCIASGLGFRDAQEYFSHDAAFAERSGQYVVELADGARIDSTPDATVRPIGQVEDSGRMRTDASGHAASDISIDDLAAAWCGTLDW
jgi:phosphoribosylformylglycinamidine synthase